MTSLFNPGLKHDACTDEARALLVMLASGGVELRCEQLVELVTLCMPHSDSRQACVLPSLWKINLCGS